MENNEEVSQPEPDPNPGSPDQKIPANWLANFLPMFGGQIISLLGSSLVQFALVWYVTKLTGSAAVLATATTAALIPSILIGPFIGALVDRWNRKLVMILADLVVALATAVLALLFAFNLIQIWHIYLILFIRSLAGIFQGPAISPALGALLLELLPIQGVLAVDIVTAAIAILLMIFFVKVPQPKTVTGAQKVTPRSLLADVKSGFNYIVTWPGLLIVILIASSINLFLAPAGNLMPLLVTDFFNGGARELAWLQAAMGIGAILGGVLLGVWGGFKRKVVTVMIGILGVSLSVIGVGLVPQDGYITAIVLAGLTGLMLSFANGSLGPLLQTKVPSEKQGRVFTVLSSMSLGLMPIGLFLSAPIADRYGASVAYLIGGTVGLGIAIFGFLNRKVMTIDDQLPGGRQLEVTGQPGQATTID
jgi:DHA3 family macrolide efflux protein-like MFS transporter